MSCLEIGEKYDDNKTDWTLLPWDAAELVVRVMMFGAEKYGRDNWKTLPDAERRYAAAAFRHLVADQNGERLDPESGLPHLAHAACSLLFLLAMEGHPDVPPPV